MFIGWKYRLGKATLALSRDERRLIAIPSSALLEVVSEPTKRGDAAMVEVMWEDKIVTMFAVDIELRGTPLSDGRAKGQASSGR